MRIARIIVFNECRYDYAEIRHFVADIITAFEAARIC